MFDRTMHELAGLDRLDGDGAKSAPTVAQAERTVGFTSGDGGFFPSLGVAASESHTVAGCEPQTRERRIGETGWPVRGRGLP